MPPIEPAAEDGDLMQMAETADNALQVQQDPVTQALAEVTTKNTKLTTLLEAGRALAKRYKDVAFDVATVKGMGEAVKARAEFRDDVRLPMQELQENGSKLLGTMQRQFNTRAREMIAEVAAAEELVDKQIKAEEARKEQVRLAKAAEEAARVQRHVDTLASITRHVTEAMGESSEQLQARITGLQDMDVSEESWEEFHGQAAQARDEAIRQLKGMLVAAKADELEAAELELERARQARVAQEQAARLADLEAREQALAAAEQRQRDAEAALQRARDERAQAVQARIDEFHEVVRRTREDAELASTSIKASRALVAEAVITADLFDDRVAEAQAAKDGALSALAELATQAEQREAEEAAEQKRATINGLIVDIAAAGNYASNAVADGSADLGKLRNLLNEVQAVTLDPDFLGDALSVAQSTRAAVIHQVEQAIAATEERDRIAAEQAQAAAAERAKVEAETARIARAHEKAPVMLALLEQLRGAIGPDAEGQSYDLETIDVVHSAAGPLIDYINGDNHA